MRNTFKHDARVLREAHTLARAGFRPLVVAVTSTEERTPREIQQGVPVLRLSPITPLARIRSRLRSGKPASRVGRLARRADEKARSAAAGSPASGRNPLTMLVVRLYRWLITIDFYRRAIGVLRAVRPAVVHCNDYNTMWVGVAARLLGGTAVVYDAHELWPDRNNRYEWRWWLLACEALFVRCAHLALTSSPGFAEVMARRYRIPPPRVVRNVPDVAATGSARGEKRSAVSRKRPGSNGRSASDQTALYVGNMLRNRGLEISIRAVASLPEVRLQLVGPIRDDYRSELAELVEREGVVERVEFLPPVAPGEVIEAIRGAGVGLALIQPVCLSYRMTLPNKLFEYVAAGVPILASDLPVIGRFVREHGVGLVARPDDVADVAAKLAEILGEERNRAFRVAARRAAGDLRWDRERPLLDQAYEDALAAAGPAPAGPGE